MAWGAGQKATGVWQRSRADRSGADCRLVERIRNGTMDVRDDVCVRETGGEEGEETGGELTVLIMM